MALTKGFKTRSETNTAIVNTIIVYVFQIIFIFIMEFFQ